MVLSASVKYTCLPQQFPILILIQLFDYCPVVQKGTAGPIGHIPFCTQETASAPQQTYLGTCLREARTASHRHDVGVD